MREEQELPRQATAASEALAVSVEQVLSYIGDLLSRGPADEEARAAVIASLSAIITNTQATVEWLTGSDPGPDVALPTASEASVAPPDAPAAREAIEQSLPGLEAGILKAIDGRSSFTANEILRKFEETVQVKPGDRGLLRSMFPDFLKTIVRAARQHGFDARWGYSDETKTRFELSITGKTEPETLPSPVVVARPRLASLSQGRPTAGFPAELMNPRLLFIDKLIATAPNQQYRYGALVRALARVLGNDTATHPHRHDAQDIINAAIAAGRYYVKTSEGTKYVVSGPEPEQKPERPRIDGARPERVKTREPWRDEDTAVLTILLRALGDVSPHHIQQGVNVNKLWTGDEKLRSVGASLERVKQLARRAADAGELTVQSVNRTRGGKGKGRSRRVSQLIAVVTNEQRIALKADPAAVLTRIRELYEAG